MYTDFSEFKMVTVTLESLSLAINEFNYQPWDTRSSDAGEIRSEWQLFSVTDSSLSLSLCVQRRWASSLPAAAPLHATVSSRNCQAWASTAATRTCATAPPAGRRTHCSCCWPCFCGCAYDSSAPRTLAMRKCTAFPHGFPLLHSSDLNGITLYTSSFWFLLVRSIT